MANCIDFNNPELASIRDNLADLIEKNIKVYDPIKSAQMILERNNGNPIHKDFNGQDSVLYSELISKLGENKGFIARINMFTDDFINRMGNWMEMGREPVFMSILPTSNDRSSGAAPQYFNDSVSSINLEESELNDENEDMLKCLGYAKNGISTSVNRGGNWRIKEYITGPSHEKGGVDVNVSGTYINVNDKPIKAEDGLYFNNDSNENITSQYVIDPVKSENNNTIGTLITNYTNNLNSVNDVKNDIIAQQKKQEEAIKKEEITSDNANEVINDDEPEIVTNYSTRYEGIGTMDTKGVKCESNMCSSFVQKEMYSNIAPDMTFENFRDKYGMKGDAWEIIDNMTDKGASIVNSNYLKGDVVEINNPNSRYLNEASKDGSGSTHVGILDEVSGNGEFLDPKFKYLTKNRVARKNSQINY